MRSPIKQLRIKHKMSQCDLAKLAKVSQGHVSAIESGFADVDEGVLKLFADMGVDVQGLQEKHERFMRAAERELKTKLKGGTKRTQKKTHASNPAK